MSNQFQLTQNACFDELIPIGVDELIPIGVDELIPMDVSDLFSRPRFLVLLCLYVYIHY
jgi:cell shape-determining protein MreD